ncbi:MAG TPA: hypothetical protein VI685_07095 [Candidatus Angelobacter sp.]
MAINEARHRGPHLGAVSIVYTSLFLASLVVTGVMTGGNHFPSPFQPADLSQAFFSQNPDAVRISAFLQFGAAIPLGIFAATAVSRLQFLGMNVAGVFISLFGGFAASLFIAISAALQWVLSQPGLARDPGATRILHLSTFATGGPGFVVPFGLLVAGISAISAFTKFLPRWLVVLGFVVAAAAELSSLSLVSMPFAYLLPVGRFLGIVWIIATGFLLPVSRAEAQRRTAPQAA